MLCPHPHLPMLDFCNPGTQDTWNIHAGLCNDAKRGWCWWTATYLHPLAPWWPHRYCTIQVCWLVNRYWVSILWRSSQCLQKSTSSESQYYWKLQQQWQLFPILPDPKRPPGAAVEKKITPLLLTWSFSWLISALGIIQRQDHQHGHGKMLYGMMHVQNLLKTPPFMSEGRTIVTQPQHTNRTLEPKAEGCGTHNHSTKYTSISSRIMYMIQKMIKFIFFQGRDDYYSKVKIFVPTTDWFLNDFHSKYLLMVMNQPPPYFSKNWMGVFLVLPNYYGNQFFNNNQRDKN